MWHLFYVTFLKVFVFPDTVLSKLGQTLPSIMCDCDFCYGNIFEYLKGPQFFSSTLGHGDKTLITNTEWFIITPVFANTGKLLSLHALHYQSLDRLRGSVGYQRHRALSHFAKTPSWSQNLSAEMGSYCYPYQTD